MNLTFSSGGTNYTASTNDIFMDNGAMISYIRNGKYSDPTERRIHLSDKEWRRIKPALVQLDYEKYYGRKAAISGVTIFKVKDQQ